jgi:adenylosuccinate lyase
MELSNLTALSPLDGRYSDKTSELAPIMSEFGLIRARIKVEIEWLIFLAQQHNIHEIDSFNNSQVEQLRSLYQQFTVDAAVQIKHIENTTNHDVKAVEYYIKEYLSKYPEYDKYLSFIHFACTSEDINNLAYGLMIKECCTNVLEKHINTILNKLSNMGTEYAKHAMLARTHGQCASPTTMGKELINFTDRLNKQLLIFKNVKITGKFNGAVGNYNAHLAAYPNINWPVITKIFVETLGLEFNAYTTQINPHDDIAELSHSLIRLNNILLDLAKDLWGYIALNYFEQKIKTTEVGSSTMPHKVNPIDFENAEGNLGLANSLLNFFSNKLPISRWQRDLSDSTVLRNVGSAFGYTILAYQSIIKGLDKLKLNTNLLRADLNKHWEILAEPIQTIMRRYGIDNAYEQLKELTRGTQLDQTLLNEFINSQQLPKEVKDKLKQMTPFEYIGYAAELANNWQK